MSSYSKLSDTFWTGETGRQIRAHGQTAQLVALYLLSAPTGNMLGLYYLPIPYLCHNVAGLTPKGALKALASLSEVGFSAYDNATEMVWVYEMAAWQIDDRLDQSDNRVKAIRKEYQNLPENPFLRPFFEKYAKAFHLTQPRGLEGAYQAPPKPITVTVTEKDNYNVAVTPQPSVDGEKKNGHPTLTAQALEVLDFLNQKTKRNFRGLDGNNRPTVNLTLVIDRLKTGITTQDCKTVIARKHRDWSGDDKMRKYLRPSTLFRASNFEQYLGECVAE